MRAGPFHKAARLLAGILLPLWIVAAQNGVNPLFKGGDPWVVFDNGTYYYSASGCGAADICLKTAKTLTGLSSAPWVGIWSAPKAGPNSRDVWAPELHKVDGGWYIYYAADDGDNNHHRLFVLKADTDDPLKSYSMGATGGTNGQILESTGNWGIDPDVFTGANGKQYLVWSCTNFKNSAFPQATCLTEMRDALHPAGNTAQISSPTELWEKRTQPIQEGPVGYTRNGRTYITYSASASWTDNDYAVGLLANLDGRLLNPGSWLKSGPIFDHHDTAYGTGSVMFVQSLDGRETWNFYHGIDNLTCSPSYNCRDIRMQKMDWNPDGSPLLGSPLDPGVPFGSPSGEPGGGNSGSEAVAWGNAFGDAAEGYQSAGRMLGSWMTADTLRNDPSIAGRNQVFKRSNPNLENYTVVVDARLVETKQGAASPKYGVYAAYADRNNHVTVSVDSGNHAIVSGGMVGGTERGPEMCALPDAFDVRAFNKLEIRKKGSVFSIYLNGSHLAGACNDRVFEILNGQIGLLTDDAVAEYKGVRVIASGPSFASTAVVNSASSLANGLAPGEIIAIFGSGLGPVDGVAAGQLSGDPPRLPVSLGGVQVFFDGVAAPLFYVSNDQINVQAPFSLAGKAQTMILTTFDGGSSNWIPVDVTPADPGLYAIVNAADGSPNSAGTPANRGEYLILYGTGQGEVDPPLDAGIAAPTVPLSLARRVSAKIGGQNARVLFAGLTPEFVGLLQVNLEVPLGAAAGQQDLELAVGSASIHVPVSLK